MRRAFLAAAVLALLRCAAAVPAGAQCQDVATVESDTRYAGDDTLWIFDADFEDLTGDNAGWLSLDMSGTPGRPNYWHKDTIRIDGFAHLGDSTWWCGTCNACWYQPRGYGNDWDCSLAREFPLSEWSEPGDAVTLEWDQRFAIEHDYDYGYVDVSTDGGSTWTTVRSFTNPGFAGKPGASQDWDSPTHGHPVLSLGVLAGADASVRFRFDSDDAYSSQDQYDNGPPWHSVLDGAWQLDNFTWKVNGEVVWFDDCEAPGDNGWEYESETPSGQTGVVFRRVFAPDDLRPQSPQWCEGLPGWWMAAVDSLTGRVVDGQNSWLVSPPIDIAGADRLVVEFWTWIDCPRESYDVFGRLGFSADNPDCWQPAAGSDEWEWWEGYGPMLWSHREDWTSACGPDWFHYTLALKNTGPAVPPSAHMTGFMLDRLRVGVPIGGPPTVWGYSWWTRFHDTFDLDEALSQIVSVEVSDDDGLAQVLLVASADAGASWQGYPMQQGGGDWWSAPAPPDLVGPATEIWYYFESTDATGVVRTRPTNAPDETYEFSVLPIVGSVSEPSILLVDKHGRKIIGEDSEFRRTSEGYVREALDILGYECDVFDVDVPSGSTYQNRGPDTTGMKYYDTQIWFAHNFNAYTVVAFDQRNLIRWLSQAAEGRERNLLLTGSDIGWELVYVGTETLGFYSTWLGSQCLGKLFEGFGIPSYCTLHDASGGFDFMTEGGGSCWLRGYT